MSKPKGRLELTWMGKDQALISSEDGKYSYDWVDPTDPRASEVKPIRITSTYGENPGDNLLITGDSGDALRSLVAVPEWADKYRGKVQMVYADPPYNTSQAFDHYADALEHSVWLTMMRDRLTLLKTLMSDEGTIWVHIDDAEMPYARVLLDEIFGRQNHIGQIVLEMNPKGRQLSKFFARSHEYLLVYCKRAEKVQLRTGLAEDVSLHDYPERDHEGTPYRLIRFRNTNKRFTPANRPNLAYPVYANPTTGEVRLNPFDGATEVRPIFGDGSPAVWRWGKPKAEEQISELHARIVNGREGIRTDVFQIDKLHMDKTKKLRTIWNGEAVGHIDVAKSEIRTLFPDSGQGFDTPKPEKLLARIIALSTDEGDIVLDCFSGSGTTIATAHKLRRRWVGVELLESTVRTFIEPRVKKIVDNHDLGGVTEASSWTGGGGYSTAVMSPSMYEVLDGEIYLSENATNETFATAIAGQLGYRLTVGAPVFCGIKGRSKLAVIDGVADENVIRAVLQNLGDGYKALVVAKGVLPEAAQLLRDLSSGSRIRLVPEDLFAKGTVK
ncbi:hypothetical protein DQ353_19265 [Arthrobacter sp. AQ5-05]|uniref:site-specific DNA-methyltransferase n=1 Tax=Arthrobacter sp. AQ5-05 TaxID=2184581 RepID=UPI000DCBCB0C|nr:site-specific DNA-methyltransferase [Arthrobacter sp. AQ5-05]RAX47317.1 hypothetical protein DQ353_19265 [Arthrobacter sp. AQ5-05]